MSQDKKAQTNRRGSFLTRRLSHDNNSAGSRADDKPKAVGSLLAAALLVGSLSTFPVTAAQADNSERIDRQVQALAASVEAVSDALFVEGSNPIVTSRELASTSSPMAEYISVLAAEAASIQAVGGVTVLDTTAQIIIDDTTADQDVSTGFLHVTRTVAELPEGELWEEMIPITLTSSGGALALTSVELLPVERLDPTEVAARAATMPTEEGAASIDLSGPTTHAVQRINATAAVNYAKKWWNGRNPAYPTKYSNDCTNFASQAMHQGGWQPVSGFYQSDKAWWYTGLTTSYSWGGAENFYRFAVNESKRATTMRYVKDLWLGDILQYKARGATNMSHTMIVTNWINNVPYLTYHTSDTLNKPFTAISHLDVTWFALNVL
ncbi:amidase domain-containing protein [Tessaracoccus sp. MC1865]|uniref:amidase domain-containing protein n=1 Tax=Tessaracoccus sp. MC1865 TaxID=2760310 RepID=UPI0016044A4D|nr:amidase domain-containing protein [Tessaracoccus sp. MC1865]MBB1484989.1 amidase domain-containing protein [Tessaracoccus sp. MC1865]MDO5676361.1 amidase domain-containing protein [Propionibacteriaceae bacterium]QTO38665.1 amidase domain-containing protein [Tessaracoccus sp. MC1865]